MVDDIQYEHIHVAYSFAWEHFQTLDTFSGWCIHIIASKYTHIRTNINIQYKYSIQIEISIFISICKLDRNDGRRK
jgi:hypothetical protein